VRDGEVTLEGLESTNGSSVNGERVRLAALGEGDVAQLGTIEVRISGRAGGSALPCTAEEFVSRALDAVHTAKAGTTFQALPDAKVASADAPVILGQAMRRLYDVVARRCSHHRARAGAR
jgi:hypothetical protein